MFCPNAKDETKLFWLNELNSVQNLTFAHSRALLKGAILSWSTGHGIRVLVLDLDLLSDWK